MASFYGNGGGGTGSGSGGISSNEVDRRIRAAVQQLTNHIIFSNVQPNNQKAGDIWFVLESDEEIVIIYEGGDSTTDDVDNIIIYDGGDSTTPTDTDIIIYDGGTSG